MPKLKYYLAHKPYGMLAQFTDEAGRAVLSELYPFEKDVYAVGRLDMDSEGLVLLTNDRRINYYLLNPKNEHEREYFVQVEGIPDGRVPDKLEKGVLIEGRMTLPAKVRLIDSPSGIEERIPPIRIRKTVPDSWLSISLIEGKNRQIRKMTASVGFPTLRLIRVRIGRLKLEGLRQGEVREINISSLKDIV